MHLDSPTGALFALHHRPAGPAARAALVFVHALAEEMNKSRRMAALQARALAQAGFAVLQPDLHGCGDSAGEFADARWPLWLQDLATAQAWLRARHPGAPLWLWGHRAGALLAAQALQPQQGPSDAVDRAGRVIGVDGLLLWQPVASGDQALRPWQRMQRVAGLLKSPPRPAAADAAAGGTAAHAGGAHAQGLHPTRTPATALQAGGYHFHPELLQALRATRLDPPPAAPSTIWLDLHDPATAAAEPAPAAAAPAPAAPPVQPAPPAAAGTWARSAAAFRHLSLPGPAFWRSAEIDVVPALLDATTQALLAACPPRHA